MKNFSKANEIGNALLVFIIISLAARQNRNATAADELLRILAYLIGSFAGRKQKFRNLLPRLISVRGVMRSITTLRR
jgi:hypothetical protein